MTTIHFCLFIIFFNFSTFRETCDVMDVAADGECGRRTEDSGYEAIFNHDEYIRD
jgi:hypothetical protein